ncbi:MAG: UvrB/UvrC motif-containing protein [Candidatus Sumerlaeia bacterium]|nr:UvrB/UvrC motif-containing protein [Candidatus Sumerlaeia bacterium]
MMKCEKCGQDDAMIKITRIERGGAPYQVHLCQTCAIEVSPYQKKLMAKQVPIDKIFKELLKGKGAVVMPEQEEAQKAATGPTCPTCNLSFADYRSTYMLGCPDCYEAFGDALAADIVRVQRASRHVDSTPPSRSLAAELQERLQAMRSELASAIEYEDFERAAFLRDEIARTERALKEALVADAAAPAPTSVEEKAP